MIQEDIMWGRIYIGAAVFGKCHLPQALTQSVVGVGGSQKNILRRDGIPAGF